VNFRAVGHVVTGVRLLRCDDAEITRLALEARDGDRSATERFVRATQADVWRFVAHLAGDVQLADDLAQETFLRALPSLKRFEARSSARTWLLSIARRVVADHIRSVKVRPKLDGGDDWQAVAERAQVEAGPGFTEGVALQEMLSSLDADRRAAFVLTQTLGLSYADAADVCDCPVGTIRSRVARAREDLVALLRDEQADRRSAV
jgi:RNA polymerase sigma-70 factor (ECF subfamily)